MDMKFWLLILGAVAVGYYAGIKYPSAVSSVTAAASGAV